MAGVQLKDGTIGLLLRSTVSTSEGNLILLEVDYTDTTTSLGLDYFRISAHHTDVVWEQHNVLRPLLILPHGRNANMPSLHMIGHG